MPKVWTSSCTNKAWIRPTPSGRAVYQMLGVFAEFERAMIRERVMAGLARAKAGGVRLGRKSLESSDPKKVRMIRTKLGEGTGVRRIARELSVGIGTVLRIRRHSARRSEVA